MVSSSGLSCRSSPRISAPMCLASGTTSSRAFVIFSFDRDRAACDDPAVAIELRAQFPRELLRVRSDDFEIARLQRLAHGGGARRAHERVLELSSRFLWNPRTRGTIRLIWPPSRSLKAGASDLYGTCTAVMPSFMSSSEVENCRLVPLPPEP